MTIADVPAPPLAGTPLGRTIATTATDIWNDSCAIDELAYAISFGAVGATANPTIVTDVWKQDPARWRGRGAPLAREGPQGGEGGDPWPGGGEKAPAGAPPLPPALRGQRAPPG